MIDSIPVSAIIMPGAPNPVKDLFRKSPPSPLSKQTYVVGGIQCTVYGLEEIRPETTSISCLWLLSPRLQTQESMGPIANRIVSAWNSKGTNSPGLIAVTFDQRNHGGRQVDPVANEAWRGGNGLHAQDMFSIYHGTQLDCSQLITYIPSYIFPDGEKKITSHMALGVSLGGHCVWHCLLHEPRIRTGVVVIGCPDYLKLMTDRARLSKLKTWTESDPPGATFVGSRDFPTTLLDAVDVYDPAGLLQRHTMPMYQAEVIGKKLSGKRIMNLSGGADKLVPYRQSEPFLSWFKGMIGRDGEAAEHGVVLVDNVYDGVGHEMTADMVTDAIEFLSESLAKGEKGETTERGAKL